MSGISGLVTRGLAMSLSCSVVMISGGCGVKHAVAPRVNVEPEAIQSFSVESYANQSLNMSSAQLFLWPENVTSDEVKEVLDTSNIIRDLNKKSKSLQNSMSVLNTKLEGVTDQIDKKSSEIGIKKNAAKKAEYRLKKNEKDFAVAVAARDKELSNPNHTDASLKEKEDVVTRLQNEKSAIEKEQQALLTEQQQLEAEKAALVGSSQEERDELDKLNKEQQTNIETNKVYLDRIFQVVTWYDPQPSVSFTFGSNSSLTVFISKWGLDKDTQLDFSSEPSQGTGRTRITNVRYRPEGGIFDFDAIVYSDETRAQVQETYSFHLARTNYHSLDGKHYFIGDLIRKRTLPGGSVEVTKGVAKLVDNDN